MGFRKRFKNKLKSLMGSKNSEHEQSSYKKPSNVMYETTASPIDKTEPEKPFICSYSFNLLNSVDFTEFFNFSLLILFFILRVLFINSTISLKVLWYLKPI